MWCSSPRAADQIRQLHPTLVILDEATYLDGSKEA